MTIRSVFAAALALTALTACFPDPEKVDTGDTSSGSSDGLRSGGYVMTFTSVVSDSCGLDFQTGSSETVVLDVGQDYLNFTNSSGVQIEFEGSGDEWTRDFSELQEVEDPCYIRVSVEETLRAVGSNDFVINTSTSQSIEGDCSAFDTTGYPCSYELRLDGTYAE